METIDWIIIILFLISLKNMYPVVLNVINPDLNLEDAPFGKFIIKNLHGTELKESIPWVAFVILILLVITKVCKSNLKFKLPVILLLLYLPVLFVFPLTTLDNIYLKIKLPKNEPFLDNVNEIFPQNEELEKNFNVYKTELDNYMNSQTDIQCVHSKTPGFIIGKTEKKCWRTLQIKTAGTFVNNFEGICPSLYKVLNNKSVSNAFLSILDPGVNIPKHVGYSRIYLRYHLGIDIPPTENKPFIVCGDKKYTWKQGKGVIFDDMNVHYVENPTDYKRVVLYLDLIRPELINDKITNIILDLINSNIFVKSYNKNQHNSKKIEHSS